jgi:predicted PurR-regulated permease PerM
MNEIKFWRAMGTLFLLALILIFAIQVWNVLFPFLVGLILAYLVSPLVDPFVANGYRRDRIVIVIYLILLGVGIYLVSWLGPTLFQQANEAIQEAPEYAKTLNDLVNRGNIIIQKWMTQFLGPMAPQIKIPFQAESFMETLVYNLPSNLMNVAHVGIWIIIVPFVSFFALTQGSRWVDAIFNWTPSEYVEGLLGIIAEINARVGAFVRGVLLESMIVGFVTMMGLFFMGVEGAVLIGFVTAIVNFVPFMAPLIGGSMALLMAYFQTKSMVLLLSICILFISIRLLDDFVLIPFVVGGSVRLHPVFTLFAVLAGVELGGFIGLLFAIPVAFIVSVIFSIATRQREEQVRFKGQILYS